MRIVVISLALILISVPANAEPVTQADLLLRMIDVERLVTPPADGLRTRMFSSYDRKSKIGADGELIDWRANWDRGHYLGRDDDGWDIMADVTGPGAITRIWSANPEGALRVMLDGELVIDVPFRKLMSGQLEPFTEPFVFRGINSYFPIGFNQRCRVLCRQSTSYYQINVVQFPPTTTVQRFTLDLDASAQAALDVVKKTLRDGLEDAQLSSGKRMMPVAVYEELGPGDVLRESLRGAGTIRALYVAVADPVDPRAEYALHQCILRLYFDGDQTPSVAVPLVDFFGSGFERIAYRSLVMGTDKELRVPLPERRHEQPDYFYCHFPMPYQDGWRLEIENLGQDRKKIGLMAYLRVDTQAPPSDALRFHARYRKEDPSKVFDYPVLEATGCGRVVGCVLNVDCPRAEWWGEGDEKIWIDGERFPSYFGTGTEDYLNDAWGLHEYIHALSGVTRAGPFGKNSAYRWHLNDAIVFHDSIRFTMENWQHNDVRDTYYSTIAYWYADRTASHFFEPITRADVTPPGLRIPGAIEIEDRIVGNEWGNPIKQKYANAELSGERAAVIATEEPVEIHIPATRARAARLKLRVNPARWFETITVRTPAGREVGEVEYDRRADGMYAVGVLRLEPGNNSVMVQCTKPAQLDCWVLEDLPRNGRGPEGEDLDVDAPSGVTLQRDYAVLDWSAGGQLVMDFTRPGQEVELPLPKQPAGLPIALRLHVTRGLSGGRFQIRHAAEPLGTPVDLYGADPTRDRVYLGTFVRETGVDELVVEALAADPRSQGMRFGLDVIELPRAADPHAIECEDLIVRAEHESHHTIQPIGGSSGDEHLWCRAPRTGAWIELEVPGRQPGVYDATLILTRSYDYGVVRITLAGVEAGSADTYASEISPGLRVSLGRVELGDGPARLRIEVVDRAELSDGYYFGADCLVLEPIR